MKNPIKVIRNKPNLRYNEMVHSGIHEMLNQGILCATFFQDHKDYGRYGELYYLLATDQLPPINEIWYPKTANGVKKTKDSYGSLVETCTNGYFTFTHNSSSQNFTMSYDNTKIAEGTKPTKNVYLLTKINKLC